MGENREPLPGFVTRPWRFIRAVALRFYDDRCLIDASALAYVTLLSLVPLLALMFAILKGLGAQSLLRASYLTSFGISADVAARLINYIDNANVSTLGSMGAAALVLTVISLLGSIEDAFNRIWRVRRNRTVVRKVTDYSSVVLMTPLLLLAAAAMTSSLQFHAVLSWLLNTQLVGDAVLLGLRLFPIAINAVALGILYSVLPNRRASPAAVAIAAIAAGLTWQVVQSNYLALQVGLARYSALYGALAQLPFTLVWLYVSWVVILGGAQIAAVYEFGVGSVGGRGATSRTSIALHVLLAAADAFRAGDAPPGVADLATRLEVGPEEVRDVAESLCERGWLLPVDGHPGTFALARAAKEIALGDLAESWDGNYEAAVDDRVKDFLAAMHGAEYDLWQRQTLTALLGEAGEDSDRTHLDKQERVG